MSLAKLNIVDRPLPKGKSEVRPATTHLVVFFPSQATLASVMLSTWKEALAKSMRLLLV